MHPRLFIVAALLAVGLAGCGSGPVKRVNPPAVSIQQLSVEAGGQWRISLRIHNFSTVPVHFNSLKATLEVAGTEVGTIDIDPDVQIIGDSADVVDARLAVSAKLPQSDFAYNLKGTITSDDPRGKFDFDRDSRLSPVPGVPNTWR